MHKAKPKANKIAAPKFILGTVEWKKALQDLKSNEKIQRPPMQWQTCVCKKISDEELNAALNTVFEQGSVSQITGCDLCGGKLYLYWANTAGAKDCFFKQVCKNCNLLYDEQFYDAFG